MSDIQKEAESAVAQVKELFGPPPLLRSEDENAYNKLMLAFAITIRPRNAFSLMQLNEMTIATWRRGWFRHQQMMPLDRLVRTAIAERLRRQDLLSKSKSDAAQDAEDLANLKHLPESDRRTFELEMKIDEGNNFEELLKSGKADIDYNKALNANLTFIDRIDGHITTETRRVNEAAQWLIWYREICQDVPVTNTPEMIDAEAAPGAPAAVSDDAPLAPAQPGAAEHSQQPAVTSSETAPPIAPTEGEFSNGSEANALTGK